VLWSKYRIARFPSLSACRLWGFDLNDRGFFRAVMTSVALAAAVALAGCNGEDISLASNAKANKPIPEKLVADIAAKDMDVQSPMLVRLFKQEAELEVWKQDRSGKFALLKTYPICRWSGDLGPKVKEGDRQAPEGFYSIGPGQMNPQSAYYLSFNMGYPNAFDKALGRTGSQLMVHGDCSSRGCYAMTDEQISEIYTLGRESFFGGQRAFQVQAYPFKFTPVNMAKHRSNPNMPFWKMIKEGYDHFEVTRQEPKVEFCENKYVFDPAQPANGRPLTFQAGAKCPAYSVPSEIADAVLSKQRNDEAKTNELISKGTPMAQRRPDIDGGMNRIFASKIPDGSTGLSESDAPGAQTASYARAPGTIPAHVNPPKAIVAEEPSVFSMPAASTTQVANAGGNESGGFFSAMARKVGIGGGSSEAPTATASRAPVTPEKPKTSVAAKSTPKSTTKPSETVLARPAESFPPKKPDTRTAAARPALKPSVSADEAAASDARTTMSGATPVVSSNSFDSRFSLR
jgi:murein L,D-transpeptidase YafK